MLEIRKKKTREKVLELTKKDDGKDKNLFW